MKIFALLIIPLAFLSFNAFLDKTFLPKRRQVSCFFGAFLWSLALIFLFQFLPDIQISEKFQLSLYLNHALKEFLFLPILIFAGFPLLHPGFSLDDEEDLYESSLAWFCGGFFTMLFWKTAFNNQIWTSYDLFIYPFILLCLCFSFSLLISRFFTGILAANFPAILISSLLLMALPFLLALLPLWTMQGLSISGILILSLSACLLAAALMLGKISARG